MVRRAFDLYAYHGHTLDTLIAHWRDWLLRRPAVRDAEVEDREGRLRDAVAPLRAAGLSADEAFLVAVRRMSVQDEAAREFAREQFEREYLVAQINRFGGNISRTASFVGMERSALHRKLKSLGVITSARGGARMADAGEVEDPV